jgi:carboxypeptidase family protein/TonB-dependent receptor-like protein
MSASVRSLVLLFLGLPAAWAQISSGTIVGLVEDPSGAVIPNAEIAVKQIATGEVRTTHTNANGEFNVPFLQPGGYGVTASAGGFKSKNLSDISLRVDQTVNLRVTLEIGSSTETVEVTGSAPLVDSATSSLGQVIENKQILEMPLNLRNPFALGLLSGNTTPMFGMGSNLPFIAGGGRFSANEVTLDGVDNNTVSNAGSIGRNGIAVVPSVDAVQEFKVKTSTFSAEFGHAAGAVVNATIKSGGNQFHGTLFEFLRNDVLDANNFFTNAAGQPRPPFHQNQFGFALGGPVFIPKIYNGHNRTFFFADYQGFRQSTSGGSSSITITDVPPAALRTGDFSSVKTPIYNPATRHIGANGVVVATPFVGNTIPQSQLNKTSTAIAGLVPLPNFGGAGSLARNFFYQPSQFSNTDQGDIRVDQNLSSVNNLYARFSISENSKPATGNFPGFIGGGTSSIDNSAQAVLSDVHIFSPAIVNEFRFGYVRHNGSIFGSGQNGVGFAEQNNVALFPAPLLGFPSIAFNYSGQLSGSSEFTGWGGGDPNLNIENRFQWSDNVSWTRGSHALKFGADIRRARFDTLKGTPFFGQEIYGATFTSSSDAPGSGLPLADFLLGYPSFIQGTPMIDWGRQRSLYTGFFVQDDWKITKNLTVNIGLRYELFTQPVDARDLGSLFNIANGQYALPGKGGYTRAIVDGDHNNFGPRAGFAWQASSKLVVRGGYGLFYGERDQNQQVTQFSGNLPNVPTVSLPNVSAAQTVTPPFTINTPIQVVPTDPSLASFTAAKPYVGTIRSAGFHDSRDPMLHQFNFDIQYQLTPSVLLETSYSGAIGRDLSSLFINENQIPFSQALTGANKQANRPFPYINGTVIPTFSTASNDYNSANFRLEKRYTKGLALLVNYTIQKNLESGGAGPDAYSQNGGTSVALDTYNIARERSYAPIDVPQIFSASAAYELPFGPGKPWLSRGGLAGKIVGGWQVNTIVTLRGGFPSDIRTNVLPPIFNTFNVADRVAGQPMVLDNASVDGYFNPAAFAVPGTVLSTSGAPIQEFGDSARRVARGPGSKNADVSFFKNTTFGERMMLQFRAEFFNLTNTPTFFLPSANSPTLTCMGAPGSACNSNNPLFGKLSSGQATGRQVQFGLKLYF